MVRGFVSWGGAHRSFGVAGAGIPEEMVPVKEGVVLFVVPVGVTVLPAALGFEVVDVAEPSVVTVPGEFLPEDVAVEEGCPPRGPERRTGFRVLAALALLRRGTTVMHPTFFVSP